MLTRLMRRRFGREPGYGGLVVGSAAVALLVSLGTVGGMKLLEMEVNAALAAALAAAAAATYAGVTAKQCR